MEYVRCNLCNSNNHSSLFTAVDLRCGRSGTFTLVKCSQCRLVFLNPRPDKEEIKNFYPKVYFGSEGLLAHPETLRATGYEQDKVNAILPELLSSSRGRILDIGCGKGEFLANISRKDWEGFGVEISRIAANYARRKMGVNVFNGELKEASFPDQHFDVVTLWHALEHFHDPLAAMIEVNRILKLDGLLVLSLPNFQSFQARIMKNDWYHLDVPRHLYHFTPKTITQLLTKAGFKVLKIDYFSPTHNHDGVAFSLLRKFEHWRRRNVASIEAREAKNMLVPQASLPLTNSPSILKSLYHKAFNAFVLTFSYLENCLRRAGTMNIYATREKS